MHARKIPAIAGLLVLLALCGCAPAGAPIRPVSPVDLTRFMGRWYVIAGGAAAVAAGLTGIVFATTRGPDPGTLPPGSDTLRR